MKYWGYQHESGTLHVRRLFPGRDESLEDARESPFVAVLIEPFEANDIAAARSMLRDLVREKSA